MVFRASVCNGAQQKPSTEQSLKCATHSLQEMCAEPVPWHVHLRQSPVSYQSISAKCLECTELFRCDPQLDFVRQHSETSKDQFTLKEHRSNLTGGK